MQRFRVLIADKISKDGTDVFSQAQVPFDVKTGLNEEQLCAIIGQYDAMVVRSDTRVTKKIMDNATRLRIVARAGVGVDNINIAEATPRGIIVVNSPQGNTVAAAEHTWALILRAARGFPMDAPKRAIELSGRTLGVLGFGNIGQTVASYARGMGMKIIAYDPFVKPEAAKALGATLMDADAVLANADVITLHLPVTKDTRKLINKQRLATMKKGALLVNVSRGEVVDTAALVEALSSGHLGGAALDVFEKEPLVADSPLRKLDNVILTPHLGASTVEAQVKVAVDVCQQIVDVLAGRPARTAVNIPSMQPRVMEPVKKYLPLSEKLGLVVGQLSEQSLQKVEVEYSGDFFANLNVVPLTTTLLKGLLTPSVGEGKVNYVNTDVYVKKRGIVVEAHKTPAQSFKDSITVRAATKDLDIEVAGAHFDGLGERIVSFNGFNIDVIPEGHLLFILYREQVGVQGAIGMFLARKNINISSVDVGRLMRGGAAVIVFRVDNAISENTMAQLKEEFKQTVSAAWSVQLPVSARRYGNKSSSKL